MSLCCEVRASRGAFLLDFDFASAARVVAVEGPSGAGKTTLLMALAGLIPVETARLSVNGRRVVDTDGGLNPPTRRRRVGYVFQDTRLFPHLTVAGNIGFGRRFARSATSVEAALELMDLRGFGRRWPRTLSGGEARRVAIARALCADPDLLLLDEPFAGLDEGRRDALIPYLARLRDHTALPMLLVSHDPRDVAALAQDRVRIGGGRRV